MPARHLKTDPPGSIRTSKMFFGKSISIDEEDLGNVAAADAIQTAGVVVEAEFISRLRAGDPDAFDLLVTRHSADIYALLFRLTNDAEEASDLLQETFLSAIKAVRNFRGESQLKTWLYRIAVNHSRNRFRWWKRRRREKTVSLDSSLGYDDRPISDSVRGNLPDPEEDAMIRERRRALKKALAEIPAIFREVIILCDIEGFNYESIAVTLEINIGTVKSRLSRGREELRRRVKDF